MFDRLKGLFGRPAVAPKEAVDIPLAVAGLLIEAARADERYEESEKRLIEACLRAHFDLSAEDAAALRVRAEAVQAEATDIHRFTKVAKTLPAPEKLRLIESLWRIVLSDAERDPHEEALIRRVCGLVYVSDPESAAARRRAEAGLQSARKG